MDEKEAILKDIGFRLEKMLSCRRATGLAPADDGWTFFIDDSDLFTRRVMYEAFSCTSLGEFDKLMELCGYSENTRMFSMRDAPLETSVVLNNVLPDDLPQFRMELDALLRRYERLKDGFKKISFRLDGVDRGVERALEILQVAFSKGFESTAELQRVEEAVCALESGVDEGSCSDDLEESEASGDLGAASPEDTEPAFSLKKYAKEAQSEDDLF